MQIPVFKLAAPLSVGQDHLLDPYGPVGGLQGELPAGEDTALHGIAAHPDGCGMHQQGLHQGLGVAPVRNHLEADPRPSVLHDALREAYIQCAQARKLLAHGLPFLGVHIVHIGLDHHDTRLPL